MIPEIEATALAFGLVILTLVWLASRLIWGGLILIWDFHDWRWGIPLIVVGLAFLAVPFTPAFPVILGFVYLPLVEPLAILFYLALLAPVAMIYLAFKVVRASWHTTRTVMAAPDPTFYRRSIARPQ